MQYISLIIPCILGLTGLYALHRKTDVFSALITGAEQGLRVTIRILPSLIALLTAVYMLRASGALDALAHVCAPVLRIIGIPPETAALMFIRPVSGSAALAVGSEIMTQYGADSLIGRTAAVMLGSTETTLYVAAVYFGAAGIKNTRYAIPAALCADAAGFIAASLCSRIFWQ